MKGFGIYIKNDLLDPKHVENMGTSVWLYMWLLDKMTSVTEDGVGNVLGGKPVRYEEDIKVELGISQRTYTRWIKVLEECGYINVTQAPYGLVISVNKAKKVFNNRVDKNGDSLSHRVDKNGDSLVKNGYSNKTIQYDNTINNNIPACKIPKTKNYSEKQLTYQRICEHLEKTLNTKITNYKKQMKALQMAFKAGYNERQITWVIDQMAKDDFYNDKGFDLMTVMNQLPIYKAKARKVVNANVLQQID